MAVGGTILLTLAGPRNYDPAARNYDRAARARLRRVLVDELHEAHEPSSQLPEPHHDRLQAIAQMLYEQLADKTSLAELGRNVGHDGGITGSGRHNRMVCAMLILPQPRPSAIPGWAVRPRGPGGTDDQG